MRTLLLPVGEEWYAVALAQVREVVEGEQVTPVPLAPSAVLGLVNVRGAVVPVLDTGRLLGVEPVGAAEAVVVVDTARGPAGLAASAAPATTELGEDLGASALAAGTRRFRWADGVATGIDLELACAAEQVEA